MKKSFLLICFVLFGIIAFPQNSSPLKKNSFNKLPNEIADLRTLKEEAGRDSDYGGNQAALIRIKAQGFSESTMREFTAFPREGLEIIHKDYKNGEIWLYVSSNIHGSVVIKYSGEFEFKLPSKLEAKGVYELVLGMETATLIIKAMPENAEIYIDNEKVGTGYASMAVSVGSEHRWRVQCPDYVTKEGVKTFTERGEESLDIALDAAFGYITIKTEPSGAEVLIDEEKVGTTPYVMKKIKEGRHTVEIQKYGYLPTGDLVEIKNNDHNRQFENVTLERDEDISEIQMAQMEKTIGRTYTNAFSVSDTKTVYFSKGNLQYQPKKKIWRFAEHQWDMIGEANANVSKKYDGWIDHYGWGTGKAPTNNDIKDDHTYKEYNEWGDNVITNGDGKRWYTLSKDEWEYIFLKRITSSGMRYAKAKVNGVNGVILLPDNWDKSIYNLNYADKNLTTYNKNVISLADWTNKFEANGAVFLPAAGGRAGNKVLYAGTGGFYWESTGYEGIYAHYLFFNDEDLIATNSGYRRAGHSVRLARDAE